MVEKCLKCSGYYNKMETKKCPTCRMTMENNIIDFVLFIVMAIWIIIIILTGV